MTHTDLQWVMLICNGQNYYFYDHAYIEHILSMVLTIIQNSKDLNKWIMPKS